MVFGDGGIAHKAEYTVQSFGSASVLLFVCCTYLLDMLKERASQSNGCSPAKETVPELTICSSSGAEVIEECIGAPPSTLTWMLSVGVTVNHRDRLQIALDWQLP